jgi:hypothetical protein
VEDDLRRIGADLADQRRPRRHGLERRERG